MTFDKAALGKIFDQNSELPHLNICNSVTENAFYLKKQIGGISANVNTLDQGSINSKLVYTIGQCVHVDKAIPATRVQWREGRFHLTLSNLELLELLTPVGGAFAFFLNSWRE